MSLYDPIVSLHTPQLQGKPAFQSDADPDPTFQNDADPQNSTILHDI